MAERIVRLGINPYERSIIPYDIDGRSTWISYSDEETLINSLSKVCESCPLEGYGCKRMVGFNKEHKLINENGDIVKSPACGALNIDVVCNGDD